MKTGMVLLAAPVASADAKLLLSVATESNQRTHSGDCRMSSLGGSPLRTPPSQKFLAGKSCFLLPNLNSSSFPQSFRDVPIFLSHGKDPPMRHIFLPVCTSYSDRTSPRWKEMNAWGLSFWGFFAQLLWW